MPLESKSSFLLANTAVDCGSDLPTRCAFAPWREKIRFLFAIFGFSAVNSRYPESVKGLL
jgi:hypothetical protein